MITDCLSSDLDNCLLEHGFHRNAGSLEYARTVTECLQRIVIVIDLKPSYEPRASAHLLPQIVLVFPELNGRLLDMVDTMPSLKDVHSATFFQQIQNAAPRENRQDGTHWFLFDDDHTCRCVRSMGEFMTKWTIPFLSEYTTVQSLIRGYEAGDERLPNDRRLSLLISAAYSLLNDPEGAVKVLDKVFGRPALRRQYGRIFEYVNHQRESRDGKGAGNQ